jgi:hypothetical protein
MTFNKFVNARQQAGWTAKSFAFSCPLQRRYLECRFETTLVSHMHCATDVLSIRIRHLLTIKRNYANSLS